MFKNLHIKFFSLLLATFFWIFVVSLQNTFFQVPESIQIQVFNLAPELALATEPGSVIITVRSQDSTLVRQLSADDFEVYVDLRNVGAGERTIPISVTPKNSQVSVVRVVPKEITVDLQPVRQKSVTFTIDVDGEPASGFRVESVDLSATGTSVSGAQDILNEIGLIKAEIKLDGTETTTVIKTAAVKVYDEHGVVLESVTPDISEVQATINIVEAERSKQVGVQAQFRGSISNGVIKNVSIDPAVVTVTGQKDLLNNLEFVQTEQIGLRNVDKSFEKKVGIELPEGISFVEGQGREVTVTVEIE